jgi:hypothetical protein
MKNKNIEAMVELFETKPYNKDRIAKTHIGADCYSVGYMRCRKHEPDHRILYKNGRVIKDITLLDILPQEDYSYLYRRIILHNLIHRDLMKIYILTNVLDDVNNWVFDLSIIPTTDTLKVIYDNGTVKNINFKGVFEPIEIDRTHNNTQQERILPYKAIVKPIAYRIPTI